MTFDERRAAYRMLVSVCGLTLADAAQLLGIAPETARQKSSGAKTVSLDDVRTLARLWQRILDRDPAMTGPAARRRDDLAAIVGLLDGRD